jgi:hypothetical protein
MDNLWLEGPLLGMLNSLMENYNGLEIAKGI